MKTKASKTTLECLIMAYCKAANALSRYRQNRGFNPGVRVIAQWRNDSPKSGTIAPYGDMWNSVDHMSVPVLLDSGRYQPWCMRDLTIVK